jgi:ATP-dependent Clp protease ATP-binding subunit ClpX
VTRSPFRLANENPVTRLLSCSFCGLHETETAHLVRGPGVCICSECVEICLDIIAERSNRSPTPQPAAAP